MADKINLACMNTEFYTKLIKKFIMLIALFLILLLHTF